MIRILIFIFLTNFSYLSFCNNDYQIALNKLKEASDFFEKNILNDEQIKQVKIVLENTLQKVDSYKSEHYIAENGVLPLPVPIEVAETSLQQQNDFVLTPNSKNKEDCIYTHTAQIDNQKFNVPVEKRIDFRVVYNQLIRKPFHWNRKISEEELFQIMGIIEKKMMKIVFENLNLLKNVKYVGLAEGMEHRFRGHRSDLCNNLKKIQNKKVKCHNQTLKQSNIEMSYLINNIPKDYHKIFEALVSTVFPVHIFYASAVIADENAWNFIVRYKISDERKKYVKEEDIAKLEGYINYMNNYFNSINIENAYKENENKENEEPVSQVKLSVKRKLDFPPKGTPSGKK